MVGDILIKSLNLSDLSSAEEPQWLRAEHPHILKVCELTEGIPALLCWTKAYLFLSFQIDTVPLSIIMLETPITVWRHTVRVQ